MADIHIQREHHLGLQGARQVAWQWAEQAETDFDMACTYAEGDEQENRGQILISCMLDF